MENKDPEGNIIPGDENVTLTKDEYDKLVNTKASTIQEIADLRKKNRDLLETSQPVVEPDAVKKAIDEELKKRDSESLKKEIDAATNEFLAAHPEFSTENDTGGLKFAAYQKAVGRMNLAGAKSKDEYSQLLEDALSLMPQESVNANQTNFSSTPRTVGVVVQGVRPSAQLTPAEQKLVAGNFGGDVEAFLKVKAKRPEYIDELTKWVR